MFLVVAFPVEVLDEQGEVVRAYAARALGAFGPAAKEALPALERALQSEELQLHAMAMAEAIKKIDPGPYKVEESVPKAPEATPKP